MTTYIRISLEVGLTTILIGVIIGIYLLKKRLVLNWDNYFANFILQSFFGGCSLTCGGLIGLLTKAVNNGLFTVLALVIIVLLTGMSFYCYGAALFGAGKGRRGRRGRVYYMEEKRNPSEGGNDNDGSTYSHEEASTRGEWFKAATSMLPSYYDDGRTMSEQEERETANDIWNEYHRREDAQKEQAKEDRDSVG